MFAMIPLTRPSKHLRVSDTCFKKICRTLTTNINGQIFSSTFNDPYINLGIEEWLMNNKTLEHAVLTYQNKPSVVIGRSQNPWTECNFAALQEENINLVRRKSGGGTVYHDLGNSNYFVLMPRGSFKRTTNANMVKEALVDLGIPAEVTERKDIAVNGLKVSGSAYKLSGNKAYHHGTMLLNADLKILSKALKPLEVEITTKGVESVRSPVTNLENYCTGISHELFSDSIFKKFRSTYNYPLAETTYINSEFIKNNPSILDSANKIKSWDWTFGQTPEFSVKDVVALELFENSDLNNYEFEFTCKYGCFTKLSIRALSNDSKSSRALVEQYVDVFNQALTSHLAGYKLQRCSLQACLLLGPPELKVFNPISEKNWSNLINRLIMLSSF